MTRRIAIAAALALSLGALPLLAQGPGFGAGQHMGGPGRFDGPGGRGPMGPLPGLNRVNLTDAQRDQIRAILEQDHQSGNPEETLRQAEQTLHSAVLADVPDAQAVEAAKAALTAAQAAALSHRVEVMLKVSQVLTPAQRQALAQQPAPPGPRRRGRGGEGFRKPYI